MIKSNYQSEPFCLEISPSGKSSCYRNKGHKDDHYAPCSEHGDINCGHEEIWPIKPEDPIVVPAPQTDLELTRCERQVEKLLEKTTYFLRGNPNHAKAEQYAELQRLIVNWAIKWEPDV